jgi:DMSO/TMAO reductase YedYZ molybdopterin-dependent catalytic subunit
MPKKIISADLSCYDTLISSKALGGVILSDILNFSGIDPSITTIDFTAQEGYSVSIPINTAIRSDIIVVYDVDGSQLNEVLSLIVPETNGNICITRISSIKMSTSSVDQVLSGNSGQRIINLTKRQQLNQLRRPLSLLIHNLSRKYSDMRTQFPIEFVLIFIGVVILVIVTGFAVYSRKKNQLLNTKY